MKLKWGVLVNMIILEKSYEEISAEINTVINELSVLKQDATVKQYLKKGKDLKELKKETGMTNAQISELSGIPVSTVNKIFSGATQNPRYATLLALLAEE